ncbi:hypothetical protein IT568_03115 [bacterium]|nr:hypothetical protein [bacterium]
MTNQMELIWKKLKSLGWEEKWVREHILPDWWSDDLAENLVNKRQAELILSKFLGIPLEQLINNEEILERNSFETKLCFKTNSGKDDEKLYHSSKICYSLGKGILFNLKLMKKNIL